MSGAHTIHADPDSKNGQELICRTEFHGQVEYRASVTIARRTAEDLVLPQSKLLCGMPDSRPILLFWLTKRVIGSTDGSLSTLTAVDEVAFKRLQLLQGQLTGKVQHVAGLNPRAFRYEPHYSSYVQLADAQVAGSCGTTTSHGPSRGGSWTGICWRRLRNCRCRGRTSLRARSGRIGRLC